MTYVKKKTGALMVVAAAAFAISMASPAHAADFSGKKITLLVPYGEGGGADTIARLMQPYLEKALPGNPTVVVLNRPGGGGVKGSNKFDASAPKDGTELIIASTSGHISYTLGNAATNYDPTKWEGVMGLPRGAIVYTNAERTGITGKDPKADVAALRKAQVINGSKAPIATELLDTVALHMLGVDVTTVFGLSTSKQRQAFWRGEINVNNDGSGVYTQKMESATDGAKATPLFAYGYMTADGTIKRDPDHPDIPTFNDFYEAAMGRAPSGTPYAAFLNLYANKVSLSKVIALPAGTPKDIVETHIAAFKEIYKDPELKKALATEFGGMPVTFGEETNKALTEGLRIKPETKEWLSKLLQKKYDVSL